MHSNLRKLYIEEIEKNLNVLGSQPLADIGQILIEAQTGLKIEKRGQSISGEPIGWIVDAHSVGMKVTGEFSAELNYFKDYQNKKIKFDLRHSFDKAPNAEKYFLLSNRKCGPKKLVELTNFLNRFGAKKNKQIFIQDSVSISTYIVDEIIEKQDYQNINRLAAIIEPIERIKNEHIFTNTLPEINIDYKLRSSDETEILDKIKKDMCVLLYGISGIGKTYLAVSIANKILSNDSEIVPIWIDGRGISKVDDLYSLKIDRIGVSQNIIGLMQRFKTVVVIDNLESSIEQTIEFIKDKVSKDFSLIITSQIEATTKSKYGINFLDDELSKEILNYNLITPCPDDLFIKIYNSINGHAFLLNQINILVNSGTSWDDIDAELKHLPASEVNNAQAFFDQLFSNHLKALNKELCCLKWINSKTIEYELINQLIGNTGISKIKSRSFFNTINKTSITLHDIVFNSLQLTEIHFDSKIFEKIFSDGLKKWFLNYDPNYYRVIHSHRDLIIKILSVNKEIGIFSYSYLQATPLHLYDKRILPDFKIEIIRDVFQNYQDEKYFILLSWIENIEVNYRIIKDREGIEKAKDFLNDYIREMQTLISNAHTLPESVLLDVKNHLGKFYRNKGLEKEAIDEFNQILVINNKFWAAKFHLAKIHRQSDKATAESYIREILGAYGKESDISSTIVLAAFKEIRSFEELDKDFLTIFIDSFYSLINETFVNSFDLPYEVLGALASRIGFKFPEKLIHLTDKLPIPSENSIDYKTIFDIGQIYTRTGEAFLYVKKTEMATSYFNQAKAYYNKIKKPTDFQKRGIAENHLHLDESEEAKQLLFQIDEKGRENFWKYSYAKVLRKQNDFPNAMNTINEVIDNASLAKKYSSTMYRERALIKIAAGDKSFMDDYKTALDECSDDVFKKMIIDEINDINNNKK